MPSAAKIAANRANARASTGPKSAAGRRRSARNAFRHGLTLPVYSDPALTPQIEALANAIAGPGAETEIKELARDVAEAEIELRRVRLARHQLLADKLARSWYNTPANDLRTVRVLTRFLDTGVLFWHEKYMLEKDRGEAHKFETFLSLERAQLFALDRYERRALSRRKFAIRALDDARAGSIPSPVGPMGKLIDLEN